MNPEISNTDRTPSDDRQSPKRIVVKLGTAILTKGIGLVDTTKIESICAQIATLKKQGHEVLVVSSGAIGMGMGALGLTTRPQSIDKQQACAGIGQSLLTQTWQSGFTPHGITVGQVLLTHEGLHIRNRYVNAKQTLERMLAYGAVPIINENDTVSAREIRFGNNDLLSAMVASLIDADQLQILTTVPGLLDFDNGSQLITDVSHITKEIEALAQGTTNITAVGGMISKIDAAKLSTESNCDTYIADGTEADIIIRIANGEKIGTHFHRSEEKTSSKKRWLAYFHQPEFSVTIDAGAETALIQKGKSLLLAGISQCNGTFESGTVIDILDTEGQAIARAETKLSSDDIKTARRMDEAERSEAYPKRGNPIVAHRDSLVLL